MLSNCQSDSKSCLPRDQAGWFCRITRIILPEPSPFLSRSQFLLNEQLPQ